ncbi:MAG: hypothetical protein M1820_009481 [Bogoriella megaspora]|nr:MAG: hypothetical protein M1820_009481 [Bogoriella megaspora]
MNGVPPAGAARAWQELRNEAGRPYYHNVQTGQVVWDKPDALMSAAEVTEALLYPQRAMRDLPWKEYTSTEKETFGKKYWHNKESGETTWTQPEALTKLLAQIPASLPPRPAAPQQPTFVAGGTASYDHQQQPPQRERGERNEPWRTQNTMQDRDADYAREEKGGIRASGGKDQPSYASPEEAQAAFLKLLRQSGVQTDWTLPRAMQAIMKDPRFGAVPSPKERMLAFEKYVVEQRAQEKDREKDRLAKLRNDFEVMLKRHPEIKHYSRWKTVRPIIENETIFRSTDNEDERRQCFDEYIAELKKQNVEQEASTRKAAMDELMDILNSLELAPYTRWSDAQSKIQSNEQFENDPKFQSLSKSDVLTAFESHIKAVERTFNDRRQEEKAHKVRTERQIRDAFIALLNDFKVKGRINAGTKWKDIYPLIENDPRYTNMLGQSGSTPLDLFWDVIEEEDLALRGKRHAALEVLKDRRYEVTLQTSLNEFAKVMHDDPRTKNFDRDTVNLIFKRVQEKVAKRAEEDSYESNRRQRRAIDELRSLIKHLDPPITFSDTWDRVRPRVEHTPEYKKLDSDDLRKQAFDKVHRRLKEKEVVDEEEQQQQQQQRDRDRRHHHTPRDRNGVSSSHRDRDGGHASRRRRTATPEVDAYEADRRKATADRERQYRKSGGAGSTSTGLSPPPARSPSLRDRPDWDRPATTGAREGRGGGVGAHGYERDRRSEREGDRERGGYLSRGGDARRGSGSRELDYGDGGVLGSGGKHRRSGSEEGEIVSREREREVKRVRREREREREDGERGAFVSSTVAGRRLRSYSVEEKEVEKEKERERKEDVAMQSGSEEGEIEEVEMGG